MLHLEQFIKIEKSTQAIERISNYIAKLGTCKMFENDLLLYSGTIYKLPFIPCAGTLSNNCYIKVDKDNFTLYTINGYLQKVYTNERKEQFFCKSNVCKEYIKEVLKYIESINY